MMDKNDVQLAVDNTDPPCLETSKKIDRWRFYLGSYVEIKNLFNFYYLA